MTLKYVWYACPVSSTVHNQRKTTKMKQNQTFFQGTNPSLKLFFIGRKILEHFIIFIASIFRFHWKILTTFFLIYRVLQYFNDSWNLIFIRFLSNTNTNSSWETMTIIWFYSVNVNGNWAYLPEKRSFTNRS